MYATVLPNLDKQIKTLQIPSLYSSTNNLIQTKLEVMQGLGQAMNQFKNLADESIVDGQELLEAAKQEIWKKFVDQVVAEACTGTGSLYQI
jgi:hypothetical protein